MHTAPLKSYLLIGILMLGLSACGKKDDKSVATQVAAKVGSEEISVHQINQILSRSNTAGVTPEAAKAMGKEVLEKLIDQQLAVNKALESKLDRTPETVSALEAAKRDILARTYLQKIASALPKPTQEEAKKYYDEHPQLFSQRRIFNIQEIVAPVTPGLVEQLRAMAAASKSMDEVAKQLQSKNIKFNGGSASRPAEQIPLELLAKVHALQDGQSLVLDTPQSVTYLRLASSQSAPVDPTTALPRIEQFLSNQRATEAVAAEMKQLRASTTITYMGEFQATQQAATTAPLLATQEPKKDTPNKPLELMDKAQSTIEKGVAGLK